MSSQLKTLTTIFKEVELLKNSNRTGKFFVQCSLRLKLGFPDAERQCDPILSIFLHMLLLSMHVLREGEREVIRERREVVMVSKLVLRLDGDSFNLFVCGRKCITTM
jgi:hypothetical protein